MPQIAVVSAIAFGSVLGRRFGLDAHKPQHVVLPRHRHRHHSCQASFMVRSGALLSDDNLPALLQPGRPTRYVLDSRPLGDSPAAGFVGPLPAGDRGGGGPMGVGGFLPGEAASAPAGASVLTAWVSCCWAWGAAVEAASSAPRSVAVLCWASAVVVVEVGPTAYI